MLLGSLLVSKGTKVDYQLIRSNVRKKQWLNETTFNDSDDDDKWKSWVEAESYRRQAVNKSMNVL